MFARKKNSTLSWDSPTSDGAFISSKFIVIVQGPYELSVRQVLARERGVAGGRGVARGSVWKMEGSISRARESEREGVIWSVYSTSCKAHPFLKEQHKHQATKTQKAHNTKAKHNAASSGGRESS